jgi:manganese/iron transport system permease protein
MESLGSTLAVTLQAFAASTILGVATAIAFTQSRLIERTLYPYAVILQVTPVVAIAPLILIWVGFERINLALVIVAALAATGIVLVVAMLIAPGAIGFVATRRFDAMMAVATGVSVSACVLGVLASFHLDVATAPLIVVLQAGCFLPALWIGKRLR